MSDTPKVIEIDKEKRFLVTYLDQPVFCCDKTEEVTQFLEQYLILYAFLKVYDNGVHMFENQYLEYRGPLFGLPWF